MSFGIGAQLDDCLTWAKATAQQPVLMQPLRA